MKNARGQQGNSGGFTPEEEKLVHDVMAQYSLRNDVRKNIYNEVDAIWHNPQSWWHGKKLDAFVWLPVLIQLRIDWPSIKASTGELSFDYLARIYEPLPKGFPGIDDVFAKLGNPLDKSILAHFISNKALRNWGGPRYWAIVLQDIASKPPNELGELYKKFDEYYLNSSKNKLITSSMEREAKGLFHQRFANSQALAQKLWEEKRKLDEKKAAEEAKARAEAEAKAEAEAEAKARAEAKAKADADCRARIAAFTEADSRRNGWPALDDNLLTDPLRGHWDLWGRNDANVEEIDGQKLYGRDPEKDIQHNVAVSIDFGTSSTVVAVRRNGEDRLLRVGVSDWLESPKPAHFENPTCLEFVDGQKFIAAWNGEYYRPEISWADLKCAHQARNDISPLAASRMINSIVRDLKTWAARGAKGQDVLDQAGEKVLLDAGKDAAHVNPLEIYAFHLGLALNNQYQNDGRIYHRYFMSFPATFGNALRGQILEAFRRGLERSLPKSLGERDDWRKDQPFEVRAGVDEPVAYAACALADADLEEGARLDFGVFDFGGGTTDFAFGRYRETTPDEERRTGREYVIELLDVTGLADLGGENLLHALAHQLVCANLAEMAAKQIPFAPAPGEPEPIGAERVFGDGLKARSNSMRLIEALRPFWEEGPEALDAEGEGVLRIGLQSLTGGEDLIVALKLDRESMEKTLRERIGRGVDAFFAAFRQAFKRHGIDPDALHILPAGNACRSPIVAQCFEERIRDIAANENVNPDLFILHDLLLPDEANPEAPNLKTGVALGQLLTVPGESVYVEPVAELANPDEVFHYTFGTFRRNRLKPALTRFSRNGEWLDLGLVREDLFLIAGWSDSPIALEGKLARKEAHELTINFDPEEAGREIYARPIGPNSIEIATGDADGKIDETRIRKFTLGS